MSDHELTPAEQKQLADLDEALAKFEAQKRWSDYIRTILQKVEVVRDPALKVDFLTQAGMAYIERSSNQAEAIKAFERVLEIDKTNRAAIGQLQGLYEKRRDWEKLIWVRRLEVELMEPDERPMMMLEIAKLGTERLRKPEVCIDLWQQVLVYDEENPDALTNLAQMYERSRDFAKLATVLEKLTEQISDQNELKNQLQKLGMIYADKVGDDAGAVRAFTKLLALDPEDKRAQEQLKRRYVALKAWNELEQFYAGNEKWDELIRILEREAEAAETSNEDKIALNFQTARLWEQKKQKTDRAARAYEKVLSLDENNLQAAEALTPIYEAAGDAKKLAGVYEVRLKHVTDPDERLMMLREVGLLYEEKLKQPQTAFERFIEAFGIQPLNEVVREDVERLAKVTDGYGQVLRAYEKAIGQAQDEDAQVELRMHFGRVLGDVDKVEDAIAQFHSVYELRPDHGDAIAALGQLYRKTNRYRELLEIFERRMQLETDPEARLRLAYDRASLLENELKAPMPAIEAYKNILEDYGDAERNAYRSLDRLYEHQSMWPEFAQILERRIELGPDSHEELAALQFRLARAQERHLGDKVTAVDLYRQVLTLMPDHDGARAALEGLLDDGEVGVLAAEILEPIYESRNEWEPLVRALRVLYTGSRDADRRVGLLTKIGEVYGSQIEDSRRSFEAFCEAFKEAPDREDTLSRLEILAMENDRFKDLVELVCELARTTNDEALSRSLWMRAANMYEIQLGDVDGAVEAYRTVLGSNPGDLEVLLALEALYRRTERWRDLNAVLRRRGELATDPAQTEELLAQMATITDEKLGEPDNAISIYREILELDPTSVRALAALDGLFERQQRWSDLADNVDRQLAMAEEPDEQIRYMLRLADLRERRMNAVEAAIEIYRSVLEREPTNEPALGALERLIQLPDHRLAIAEVLEPIYRDQNLFPKLIGVHEIQAEHASSPDRRVELLHRIAELYEVALDDYNAAFHTHARALAEDPSSAKTQENLERLAAVTASYEALAQVYEQRVEGLEDAQVAALLHMKAASVREEQLGDVEGAINHYRQVLAVDANHLDAATSLERLFQMAERYEDLATIYMTKAGMLQQPDEQKDYLFRAAQIKEDILERPLEAIAVYHKVLEVEADDHRALDKLIELYLRLENWEPLLGVYAKKVDIVMDPEAKKRLYVEMGAVYERELNDVTKAIDTYQRILEIDPEDMMAINRLDALYFAAENWEELLSVLEREADLAQDPTEVISYRYRIAELWHHKLNDAQRAIDIYREILDVLPEHEPTLNALESMVTTGLEPVAAAGVLEPVYRQFGEWQKLIAVHEVQIRYEHDAVRKVELLHQVAELYETQLDQGGAAFDAYARALPLDNTNASTLGSLERLAEQLNRWQEVTHLYDIEIGKLRAEKSDHVVDMALRVAQIYEVQVGDVGSAIERYRIVVEADPAHVQAIEALDRLYEATERWGELAEILTKEIQVAATPDQILNLQFRLGQTYQERLANVDLAIEQYKEILAAAPEHSPALSALELLFAEGVRPLDIGEILEPLYRMQEAWDRLCNVHEMQLAYQADANERVGMMHRIAEIAEERANDHGRAFIWVQRSLMEDPAHDHSKDEAERLARILDGWPQLANTYADVVAANEHPAEHRVTIGKRLARVYEEELSDLARAEEAFRYVLGIDQKDEETLVALDRIYSETGAHESLVATLRKRIAAAEHPDDLVELHYRMGQTLDLDLHRTDEAIQVYSKVIKDLEPQHEGSIHALEEIYTNLEDWPNLYGAFEKELDVVVGDNQQAEILARMARIASDQLGQPDKAIGLWKKVLDLRGEDPEALNALGNIYAQQSNWRDLVDVLEREVAIAEADDFRIQVYADLGRIWYDKLERDRNALESWERVLDIDPGNTTALFAIAAIHRAAKHTQELVDTLNRIIEVGTATLEDSVLENVYTQLGYLYATELTQPMDAVEAYNRALEINPRNFQTMDALEAIHRNEGQWEDCIKVMEKRAEALEDPQAKIAQYLAIAKMWDEQVSDRDRGTSSYEKILLVNPLHQLAFEQLEALHRDAYRWEPLIEMYLARVDVTEDPAERIRLLRLTAKTYEEELRDKERAFDALQVAWTLDFSDKETTAELERITEATKKWNELLTAANEELQQAEDPQTKNAICLHCARWYGVKLGHPEYAIPYYQQILALDPQNVPAMKSMVELYRVTQQWKTMGQVLNQLISMTAPGQEKADVYVQLGDLCETQFNLPDQALTYYQQALEQDSLNLGALDALERIYEARGQWSDLLEMRQRKARALTDPEKVIETRLLVADVYEARLSDPDSAIETYQLVTQQEPTNLPALKGLERLYAYKERWQDLLQVLETQYDVVNTEKERISILMRLAGMWEEEFVKPDKAAERLEQVLEIDPQHDGALDGLARIYRNMQRWDQLIATYERHINATPDRAEKVRLYKSMGDVFSYELNDADRAIDSYLSVLSLNDSDVEALERLSRLYEKRGDHSSSLDMLEQLSRLVSEPSQMVDLAFRMGKIMDEQLGDRSGAVDKYQRAVDVEPGHLPSLEALRKIHVDSGDWLAASRVLEQETQYQQNARVVSRLLTELGQIYEERLDEHDRAIEVFAAAQRQDPDNEEAALPLVDEYSKAERWADAFPLLQMLVKRGQKREQAEQHRLAFMLGEAASKLGDDEEAIKALSKAYQLDSTHLPSLLALAAAYYRVKDWDKAFKFYQMLLVHHRDSLGREETTDIFYRLGVIKREQNERRKAINMFDKALEEDPQHRPTLEAMVGLYETTNEWEQVIHFKRQILEVVDNDNDRFQLLDQIGDLWKDKVKNLQKAIASWVDGIAMKPNEHKVLHKLLAAYQETRQSEKMIDTIQAISDLDERPVAKAKYAYTIAVIVRDEMKDPAGAVDKFNEALDLDPDQLKAFEAINKLLTQQKDWKQLERAFRKMLRRIVGKGNKELEFNLWHNLGVIYRDRLRNFESAAEAFAMASQVYPDNEVEHQILAELYSVIPSRLQNAIDEHQWLLRKDPYKVDSYRALYKLYFDARAYDKAWCLASTLTFLQKADAEQQQFYDQYKQAGMIRPQSRVGNEAWVKDLFHPDEDIYVSKVFELVFPAVHALKQSTDKALHLSKKHFVDPATSSVAFARTFGFVAQVLNLTLTPRLFLRPDAQGGLMHVTGSNPPAAVCGAGLLSGFSPNDLTYVIARHLAYYRPEHFIRTLITSQSEMKVIFLAGLRLAGVGPADPAVDSTAQQLSGKLTPAHIDALRNVGKKFLEAGARTDVKQWMQAVELTGCRAGFLLCNDLSIAARMIQALPAEGPVDLAPKDKIKEVVLFSVSESYFRLREQLGIQITV